jgi:hypothetical protein
MAPAPRRRDLTRVQARPLRCLSATPDVHATVREDEPVEPSRIVPAFLVGLSLVTAACTGSDTPTPTPSGSIDTSTFAAQVATTDLAVDRPERVQVGVFSQTQDAGVRLLAFGDVQLSFSYLGTDGSADPQPGPTATATYLPAPTTASAGDGPVLAEPSQARGVYQVEGLRFDRVGIWNAQVAADVIGLGALTLNAPFTVKPSPSLPAPGDEALKTENLTLDSKAPPVAIDSRAQDGQPVPDPELHRWTIADAISQHRPALVLFATPVYCTSQMCGPSTEALAELARRYPDRAVYIHVEIWRNHDKSVVNQAAADWLYRDGDLTEPWLYLIGANGVIQDRWGPVFDVDEVARELRALPPMKS